jgi:ABC-type branched-subunit amino acid transport system ATPase component
MSGTGAAALDVEDLSVSFGGVQALQGVTFKIEPGKIVGVMGPNGAGKTTLFNLITGVYRPSAGKIRFGGVELQGFKPSRVCRTGIARTFQSGRPFTNLSVRENVLVGFFYGTERRGGHDEGLSEAERVLDFVGMAKQADRPVASLNIMERKIVELARALATRPKLLLLDELLAGMNPLDLDPAIAIIRRVRDELGITVFWIEHIMQVLMNTCEHLIVLHHGEKLAEGAPHTVADDSTVAEAYFGKRGKGAFV